ncbi:hypothetical protein [Actinoplanes sp. NPDC020271]|uniref:hypothetical protein n=1 Tax=Actinoplanes sp. NPDC020271 TaxID=3363896 RepID=UPI0037A972FC
MRRSLILLALTLAGCGGGTGTAAPPPVNDRWQSCDRVITDDRSTTRLDDTFRPVSAVICARSPTGAGRPSSDIATLVAALRLPDEERTDGPCTLMLVTPPWIALIDAQGRWIHPGVPVNACGQPRAEVMDAAAKLKGE